LLVEYQDTNWVIRESYP